MALQTAPAKRRVLVVDDEPLVCEAVKMMLEFDAHVVDTANNGEEALTQFEPGKYDVVITDFAMPGMQGDKLALAIKERAPKQAVVMLSAHGGVLIAMGRQLAGVDRIMEKPFRLETLREAITNVLEPPSAGLDPRQRSCEAPKPGACLPPI